MHSQELKLTIIQRALADAAGLAQRGDHDGIPAWDAAVSSMAAEFKALKKRADILYIVTAIGAFTILAQKTTGEMSVEVATIKLPLSILSKQAMAILLSGAFGYYLAAVISAAMVRGSIQTVLQRAAPEGWEFLLCRYEADLLWTNMLRPKMGGYTSPVREKIIAVIVQLSNNAIVLGHALLVIGAICVAGIAAIDARSCFGMALSGLALFGVVGAYLACLLALFWKLPYRPPLSSETAPHG
jgi:hypothetical protein